MTVSELKKQLEAYPDDMLILGQSDEDGYRRKLRGPDILHVITWYDGYFQEAAGLDHYQEVLSLE